MLDQVDAPFLDDLRRARERHPSARDGVLASVGWKPKPPPSRNYAELLRLFPDCVKKK